MFLNEFIFDFVDYWAIRWFKIRESFEWDVFLWRNIFLGSNIFF